MIKLPKYFGRWNTQKPGGHILGRYKGMRLAIVGAVIAAVVGFS